MAKKDKSDKKKKSGKPKPGRSPEDSGLGAALTQAARQFRTVQSRLLAASGLYAGQEGVILLLAEEDGQTPGHLAQRLGVKAPTMTRTISRMEAQGFLQRRGSDSDARLTRVFLTDSGQATVARITDANREAERQATQTMGGKEIRHLVKALHGLDANLQGHAVSPAASAAAAASAPSVPSSPALPETDPADIED